MLADARAGIGVRTLEQRIDAVADAKRQKLHARAVIEIGQPGPERLIVSGDVIPPAFVAIVDRLRRWAVLQFLGLGREEDVADIGLEAAGRVGVDEGVAQKLVQQHGHGDVRMFCQRVAQSQGAMGGQLDHETLGQRLDAVFLILLGLGGLAADGDDRALDGRRIGLIAPGRLAIGLGLGLILGADITAVDRQRAVDVEADEGAGDCDVGLIVADRTVLEGLQGLLDFAETLIDRVGQLVGLGIFRFDPVIFLAQRFAGRTLLVGQIDRGAGKLTQAVVVAVGEAHRDLDPLPAFLGDLIGGGFQLLRHHTVEQDGVLQPTAVVGLEEIAQHDPA